MKVKMKRKPIKFLHVRLTRICFPSAFFKMRSINRACVIMWLQFYSENVRLILRIKMESFDVEPLSISNLFSICLSICIYSLTETYAEILNNSLQQCLYTKGITILKYRHTPSCFQNMRPSSSGMKIGVCICWVKVEWYYAENGSTWKA